MANGDLEWQRFAVGERSTRPNWSNDECKPLTNIYHIAHIPTAVDIVRSGHLEPRLVYDESKLNDRRISVTWLSPNSWYPGSRYGNVQFTFDWKRLAEGDGKRFYWVESIAYGVAACRILITKHDHSGEKDLVEFDPTKRDGPWWWDKETDTHWWNGHYCLEIMAEARLDISKCQQIEFVSHHPYGCCIDPKTCEYKGLSEEQAAAEFVAAIIAQEMNVSSLKFIPAGKSAFTVFDTISKGCSQIWVRAKHASFSGTVTAEMPAALPVVRAALGAYARRNLEEFQILVALFVAAPEFQRAFEALFKATFGVPPADLDGRFFFD